MSESPNFVGLLYVYHLIFRFKAFNSQLRSRNVYANRLAPSRDIAHGFNVIGHLRSLCAGGVLDNSDRRYYMLHVQTFILKVDILSQPICLGSTHTLKSCEGSKGVGCIVGVLRAGVHHSKMF